jgi:SAM-dependent methyltransferase
VRDDVTRHNQAAYDQIAAAYGDKHRSGHSFPGLREAFVARLPPAATVADLGCGPAFDGAWFARDGYRVAGLDRSAGMLSAAAQVLPGRLVQADLRRLPLARACLGGIWCSAALLHVPEEQTAAVLHEFRRVLRPGGCLALATARGEGARCEPVPYAPGVRRWFFYRPAERLCDELGAARFQVVSVTEGETSRPWVKILATG